MKFPSHDFESCASAIPPFRHGIILSLHLGRAGCCFGSPFGHSSCKMGSLLLMASSRIYARRSAALNRALHALGSASIPPFRLGIILSLHLGRAGCCFGSPVVATRTCLTLSPTNVGVRFTCARLLLFACKFYTKIFGEHACACNKAA